MLFGPGEKIRRQDLLDALPREARPLARAVWARRAELTEWLEAEPERAARLLAEPQAVLKEILPDLEIPEGVIPGEELKKEILKEISPDRIRPALEQADPAVTAATDLFRRLMDAVAAGSITPEQIAQDPDAAVQAVAPAGTTTDAITRVVSAIRFVFGLPFQLQPIEIFPIGLLPVAVEEFAGRVRPPRPG